MTKILKRAMAELASLSEADQERIGLHLLSHIEKLRLLRDDIDKGLRSLNTGEGKPIDIEEFIKRSNTRHS